MAGADLRALANKEAGTGSFGQRPAVESVLRTSSSGNAVVRDTPGEQKCSETARLARGIVQETPGHEADGGAVFGGEGLMSIRRIVAFQAGFFLAAILANAGSTKDTVRITVLDSVTQASTPDNNGVPQNCEQLTFDAYCRSTTNVPLVSTLLVREDNEPPFRISCKIESKYSRCTPLPKGESFDARREKHGLVVYYVDDKGKARKQLYTLIASSGKTGPPATAAAVATPPVPQADASLGGCSRKPEFPGAHASPAHGCGVQQVSPEKVSEKVKCNFSSTPPGAEVTVDGKYVGSTPSEIPLSTGTHVIVFSMPGFAQWKRELTVLPGSELTVGQFCRRNSRDHCGMVVAVRS
jgi:hypothetical protein